MEVVENTVSVIVPVFNAQDTLERCLTSITNQDYELAEILIVDDGSTDSSLALARDFAKKHHNIQVISQSNHGVSAARNSGLEAAAGTFIQFVDSDDFLEPHATRTLVTLMESGVDLAIAGYVANKANPPKLPRDYLIPIPVEGVVSKGELVKTHLPYLIRDGHNVNKMYKARIIKEQAIVFPEELTILEDLTFNLNYLAHISSAAFTATPIYNIENRPHSAVTSFHQVGSRAAGLIVPAIAKVVEGVELDVPEAINIDQTRYRFVIDAIRNITHPENPAKIGVQIAEISDLIRHPDIQELAHTVVLPRTRSRCINFQIRYKASVVLWAIWKAIDLFRWRPRH